MRGRHALLLKGILVRATQLLAIHSHVNPQKMCVVVKLLSSNYSRKCYYQRQNGFARVTRAPASSPQVQFRPTERWLLITFLTDE